MKRIQRGFFAAVLAGVLGFGGTQAFASPAPAGPAERVCNPTACDAACKGMAGPFASGECIDGQCFCAI